METKDFEDKDFFLNENGESIFEHPSAGKVKHLCLTDTAEVTLIKENYKGVFGEQITEIVVGGGHEIPLWEKGCTLKWKFGTQMDNFNNSAELKVYIRKIFAEAVGKWSDASPVLFQETNGTWDFEITMLPDNCNPYGCTLARAFFPNNARNQLTIFPKMFYQDYHEQVETMIHEIGHIFGLRHYFAKEKESEWRSEIFGTHQPLTIMNYGDLSSFTTQDSADLKKFYEAVWNGELTHINGLKVKLYRPYSQA